MSHPRFVQLHRTNSVPACHHDCSQGRGDCPCPEACLLPPAKDWLADTMATDRARVHAAARRAELLIARLAIGALLSSAVLIALAPAEWVMWFSGHLA